MRFSSASEASSVKLPVLRRQVTLSLFRMTRNQAREGPLRCVPLTGSPRPRMTGLVAVLRRVVAYFLFGTGTPEPGGLGRPTPWPWASSPFLSNVRTDLQHFLQGPRVSARGPPPSARGESPCVSAITGAVTSRLDESIWTRTCNTSSTQSRLCAGHVVPRALFHRVSLEKPPGG